MIDELDAAIAHEVADKAIPSISYALFDTKSVLAHGHVVPAGAPALPADALLRIGSITKTFTALAAMREVEAGRLDLDADVSRYLGPFDPTWQGERAPVTLRRLLSHRSGLTREAGRGHYLADDGAPLGATVDSLRRSRLKVAPNTYRYSNAGFALAGACIEAASGQGYADYLREHLLAPLGLADTSPRIGRKPLATAQMWDLAGDRPAPLFNLGSAPAGNIVATIDDLARYGQALLGGAIVSRETLEMMWTPAGGTAPGYGLGFMAGELAGHRTVGHGGVVYGYASQLTLLPDADLGIAMVGTLDATNHVIVRLCRYALRLALSARSGAPKPVAPRRLEPCHEDIAVRLAGRYATDDGSEIELRATPRSLMLIDRLMPLELRPIASRSFLIEGRLHGEDSGYPAPALDWDGADRLTWGGRVWARTDPRLTLPPHLAAHLGDYAPDFLPTRLIASGGKLVCVLEEFFPHACEPLGKDRFLLGPGMYQDEILELGATRPNGRAAIRVGDMLLERRA